MKFYNTIFQRSAEITRKQKVLWIFGFFVLFWGGKGMEFELFFTNTDLLARQFSPFNPTFWEIDQWAQVSLAQPFTNFTLATLLIAAGVLALFVLVMIIFSQAGLIAGFAAGASRRKVKKMSLKDAITVGEEHFWPVLWVNLLGKGASYLLLVLVSLPLFLANYNASKLVYTLMLLVVLTPVTILISILIKYAMAEIILKGSKLKEAIQNAWNLFINNVGVSVELAALMFIAYFVAILVSIFLAGLLTLPVLALGVVMAIIFQTTVFLSLYYVAAYVAAFFLVVFGVVLFSTWHFGNWTLLYLELTKGKKRSKIHRVLKGE